MYSNKQHRSFGAYSPVTTSYRLEDYLSELVIPEGNKLVGKSIRDLSSIQSFDVNILSIVRNKANIIAPHAHEILEAGDLLVVRIDPSELAKLIDKTGMMLKGAKLTSDESGKLLTASEHSLIEIVLRDDSPLIGNTAKSIRLRNDYNVNLVAISRHGVYLRGRLGEIHFRTGDILLMQVADQNIHTVLSSLKGLPLAGRGIVIGTPDQKDVVHSDLVYLPFQFS